MIEVKGDILKQSRQFVKEVWEELQKVNWTTREQLVQATKVVIISSAILGLYLGVVDFVFAAVLNWFLGKQM